MIIGVSEGWTKQLQLIGVGYRATVNGNVLVLNLGFSHPVEMPIPDGIQVKVRSISGPTVTAPTCAYHANSPKTQRHFRLVIGEGAMRLSSRLWMLWLSIGNLAVSRAESEVFLC